MNILSLVADLYVLRLIWNHGHHLEACWILLAALVINAVTSSKTS